MLRCIKYSFCILLKLVINRRKMLIRGKVSGRRDLFHVYKKKRVFNVSESPVMGNASGWSY